MAVALCGACATPGLNTASRVGGLTRAIAALGPTVDPGEAGRVAGTLLQRAQDLEVVYGRSGAPRLHNLLVNLGVRQRGLCCHFAEDLIAALRSLPLQTLDVHWAVARYGDPLREHSAVLLVERGGPWQRGLLIDAWREHGVVFWRPVEADRRYPWERHPLSGDWERLHCEEPRLFGWGGVYSPPPVGAFRLAYDRRGPS